MSDFFEKLPQEIPALRRYARALTGSRELGDDLVQDCLERACARYRQWQPDSNLRKWLFTVMHNINANQIRRYTRRPEHLPIESAQDQCDPQSVEAEVQQRDIKTALNALPETQRQVVLLVSLEGLTYEEVASVLGIAMGTVMSRLHRGRERLRELLSAHDTNTPEYRRLRRVK